MHADPINLVIAVEVEVVREFVATLVYDLRKQLGMKGQARARAFL